VEQEQQNGNHGLDFGSRHLIKED